MKKFSRALIFLALIPWPGAAQQIVPIGPTANGLAVITDSTGSVTLGDYVAKQLAKETIQGWIAPSSGNIIPAFYAHKNVFGTTSGAGLQNYFQLSADTDTLDSTSAGGSTYLYVGGNIGGAGTKSNRNGVEGFLNINAATSDTLTTSFYTAVAGITQASANAGGVGGTPAGNIFGGNFVANLKSGATFYKDIVAAEDDCAIASGASATFHTCHKIVLLSTHGASAGTENVGLGIAAQAISGATNGFATGIAFGGNEGYWPMLSSGTLMGTRSPLSAQSYTAANGIDFSAVTFSGSFLKSTGYNVDGSGNVTAASTKNTPVAIGSLPACGAGNQGTDMVVNNGTAYGTGTYGSAVSATGAVTRKVLCTNTAGATTYAWAYN